MTADERERLWDAILAWARNAPREHAGAWQRAEVDHVVDDIAKNAVRRALDVALNSGDGSYKP